jgi:zinc finger protein
LPSAERGSVYTAHIRNRADFDRQIVKSPTCTVSIPEFQLTIPPNRGQLTNVEGIVRDTMRDLALDQPLRKAIEPENYEKIGALIARMKEVLGDEDEDKDAMTWEGGGRDNAATAEEETTEGDRPDRDDVKRRKPNDEFPVDFKVAKSADTLEKPFPPFTVTLDDPAGNSFIQFLGSISDPKWTFRQYDRTREQDAAIGLQPATGPGAQEAADEGLVDPGEGKFANEEVFKFEGICSSCKQPLDTLMKKVHIPYFQVTSIRCCVVVSRTAR